ncbi:hypothetical protein ACFPTR_09970 [Aliibacillus thermotolerans]|uniref:Uncharacterized protein n=1 Tax=Aliibacillus thermotolerans TaxID=1834418 RepID=A0ABW0U8V4_9BACI|nr:hypothetical protein [Aliibacillus thermotolerans]MDA3131098.1 hypothetical protein [Aliibacillus thermotolerans]
MFSGNRLVVILPLIVVVFLTVLGGVYLLQADSVTNETLKEEVSWNIHTSKTGDIFSLEATWSWGHLPSDGVRGEDYIGVSLLDANGHLIPAEQYEVYELEVNHEQQIREGELVGSGVLFSFPNDLEENKVIGESGTVHIAIRSDISPKRAIISYLHTWEHHDGLVSKDPRFFEREFQGIDKGNESFFWVMERFEDF